MQTDFTNLVDTLYGTTTAVDEIPAVIQILQPSPNNSAQQTSKRNWKVYAYFGLGLVAFILLCYVFFSKPAVQSTTHVAPVVTKTVPELLHANISHPVELPHHDLLRAIEAVPRLSKPETFYITGEIPTSEELEQASSDTKLSSEGSDMQEYIRRREAVTKSLESNQ